MTDLMQLGSLFYWSHSSRFVPSICDCPQPVPSLGSSGTVPRLMCTRCLMQSASTLTALLTPHHTCSPARCVLHPSIPSRSNSPRTQPPRTPSRGHPSCVGPRHRKTGPHKPTLRGGGGKQSRNCTLEAVVVGPRAALHLWQTWRRLRRRLCVASPLRPTAVWLLASKPWSHSHLLCKNICL